MAEALDVPENDYFESGFPIPVSSKVLKENPKFAKLLRQLGKRLTPNGTSCHVNQEFQEAKEQLRVEKEKYMRNYILSQEIKDFVLEGELNPPSEEHCDSATAKCFARVKRVVEHAEMFDYCHEINGAAVLGVTQEVLKRTQPPQLSFTDKEFLAKGVERQLEERCKKILRAYELKEVSDAELLTKISKLPSRLEMDQRKLEMAQQDIKQLKIAHNRQMEQYFQALLAAVGILQELVEKFRLCGPPEHNDKIAKLMAIKVEAFMLKLRLAQMEVLNDTYTPETTSELKALRGALEDESRKVKEKITDVSCSLHTYDALGDEFTALVAEYKQLQTKIETNKWALNKVEN